MNLVSRCFGGDTFRPQPQVSVNKDLSFFSIVTPWGPQFQTSQISEILMQNYSTFSTDKEVTSVHKNLVCLSKEENILRKCVLAGNEQIYKTQNRGKEYSFGYEVVCGIQNKTQALFAQIGHPAVYLDRVGDPLQALGHVLDFAGGHSKLPTRLPPLPSQLFGIYEDIHCSIFSIPLKEKDRFVFISRASTPNSLLDTEKEKRTLEHFSMLLSENESSMPFWLGFLDFS